MGGNTILFSHLEGDTELIREVADLFLEECPGQMDAIRQAIGSRDAVSLEHAAHSLKGSLSIFVAPEAIQAAQELESKGHAGDLIQAEDACRRLEEQISLVQY